MRAIVMKEYGGPECLVPAERPDPVAKPGWAVVRQGEPVPGAGASAGVLYGDPSWPQAARELSPGGRGFDVVLDSIGTWQQSIGALRPGGRLVVLGASRAERANPRRAALLLRPVRPARHHHGEYP